MPKDNYSIKRTDGRGSSELAIGYTLSTLGDSRVIACRDLDSKEVKRQVQLLAKPKRTIIFINTSLETEYTYK